MKELLLLLALLLPPAQAAPTLTASWLPGGAARVSWHGAPAGSCVYAHRPDGLDVRLEPCGAAQDVVLPASGDGAYAPAGGTTYVLHDERGQADVGSVVLPRVEVWFPSVAHQ